jgi:dihydropteroate synthase
MTDMPWHIRDIEILSKLGKLATLKKPICVSVSRKSFIGYVLNLKMAEDRLVPSIACEMIAALNGANIIRTHNVRETVHALTMLQLLKKKT